MFRYCESRQINAKTIKFIGIESKLRPSVVAVGEVLHQNLVAAIAVDEEGLKLGLVCFDDRTHILDGKCFLALECGKLVDVQNSQKVAGEFEADLIFRPKSKREDFAGTSWAATIGERLVSAASCISSSPCGVHRS